MRFSVPWTVNPQFGFDPLPLLDLFLAKPDGDFERCSFLVDSGADVSMAGTGLADVLGLDWQEGTPTRVIGISPKEECVVPGWVNSVEIHILEARCRLVIPICFVDGDVQFLLGRAGFFETFRVQFDQPSLLTHFELAETSLAENRGDSRTE